MDRAAEISFQRTSASRHTRDARRVTSDDAPESSAKELESGTCIREEIIFAVRLIRWLDRGWERQDNNRLHVRGRTRLLIRVFGVSGAPVFVSSKEARRAC